MRPRLRDSDAEPEELFARYRDRGDQRAFALLFDAFGQRLFATAVKFFRSRFGDDAAHAMAHDAAQETWIRVVRKKEQWDPSLGTLTSWILGIHYHCLVDMARASLTNTAPAAAFEQARAAQVADADPERRLLACHALGEVLEALSPEDKEVLMSYYLVDRPELVASSLGISAATLRKRIERLKQGLRANPRFAELLTALGIVPRQDAKRSRS
ncbi:MAG TPA: sigma-70 family RNA polymerase sigma factor [Anaeromyxobacteraceae bacterium]|nr:sigma-70 family RNA polymerase sigma factor [Anaeromyxobacteraceae bacterium]